MRKRSGFFAYWPSQIKVFIMLLILVASGILLVAADFGESSDSLGQITDEFDTLDNVSVRVLIERNASLNAMELNYSNAIINYENFTTFTEVDAPGDLTITSDVIIDWTTMRRDSSSHAWKDYGVDYFGDFEIMFTLDMTDIEAGDASNVAICWPFAFSNSNGGRAGVHGGDGIGIELSQNAAVDDQFRYRLFQQDGGAGTFATFGAGWHGLDIYYLTLNRTGTDVWLWIYDDAGRTNLIETISNGAADITEYRYIEVAVGYDSAGDPADHSTGSIEYLALGTFLGGYEATGYFTTTDQLSSINGSVLAQLTNATIPAGTGITAEFSEDNGTWVNPTTLTAGFMAIDLRDQNWTSAHYVRYNLTTADAGETPRLYQSRLITTQGPAGAAGPGAPGQNVSGEWTFYNASEVGVTVGTLDAGSLTSLHVLGDGDIYNVSEVVGAPGMGISVNFTGIDPGSESVWLICFHLYDGNQVHDFDKEVWNYTSSAWLEFGHFGDGTEFVFLNSSVYALRIPSEFLSGGAMRFRFDHEAAGNINHDMYLDFVNVLAFTPTGPALGAGAVTVVETDPAPWIAIAIILMCVAYLLTRSR